MVEQCKAWTDFKYRRRRITRAANNSSSSATTNNNNNPSGKAASYWVEPEPIPDDLFFATPRKRKRSSLRGLYVYMNEDFAKTLDRIGFGNREDGNESRREITFHPDNISYFLALHRIKDRLGHYLYAIRRSCLFD
jgi:hypothetical protein